MISWIQSLNYHPLDLSLTGQQLLYCSTFRSATVYMKFRTKEFLVEIRLVEIVEEKNERII